MNKYWGMYFKRYPKSTLQDFIKYLYQCHLGGGHLIENIDQNYQYLLDEYHHIKYHNNHILYEEISDDLVRVHLEAIKEEDLKLYHYFFVRSASYTQGLQSFKDAIKEIKDYLHILPFCLEEYEEYVNDYSLKNYPIVRHTPLFRINYHPHYRLMKKEYIEIINIFKQINQLDQQSVILIDGHCGSGKSTLAKLISEYYHIDIIRVDDFFLQPYQRTKERFDEVGGNFDYERYIKEVVEPIKNKQSFKYQKFDCSKQELTTYYDICFDSMIVVEGSYCMHPMLGHYGDLKIFCDIDHDLQITRLTQRNPYLIDRFINEWIPRENKYFETFHIKENADIVKEAL